MSKLSSFKEGDKVITSKGRFGIIAHSNDIKSIVQIGKKDIEIYNTELLLTSNAQSVDVEYYMDNVNIYVTPLKELIMIPSNTVIYDFNNPMDNTFINICKEKLTKRINYNSVIITKIKIV